MKFEVKVAIFFVLTSHFLGMSASDNHAVLESLKCTCVPPICENSTCQMVKMDKLRSNVTVSGTVAKKLRFVKLRIRRKTQNPLKQWNKDMDFTIDYCCDFVKGANNPIIDLLAPGIRQVLGDAVRPCPYQGRFLIKYTTDPARKDPIGRPLGQLVETEVTLVTMNSQMFFKISLLSKVQ